MRLLYHHPLVASARKVRLVLGEKRLAFDERMIEPWKESEELLGLTPTGEVHRFRPQTKPDAPEVIAAIEASLPA